MESTSDKTKETAIPLNTPVQFLKGVGSQLAVLLEKLGLRTALDCLFFFPRDYEDMSELRSIEQLEEDKPLSVCGKVEKIEFRKTGPGRSMLAVLIRDGDQFLRAVWFNQPYMRDKFSHGSFVLFSGTARKRGVHWEMAHPRVEMVENESALQQGSILPVYPLTEGLRQPQVRRIIEGVIRQCASAVEEVFPEEILGQFNIWPIRTALPQVHFPTDRASIEQARRRFIFQELFVLQLAVAMRRAMVSTQRHSPSLSVNGKIDARIRRLLPFRLTAAQNHVVEEIVMDLGETHPMNRLLQGDVGTGKTVVAAYAMLVAVAHGYQAALMAPTEVLAQQHVETFRQLLSNSQVRIALLSGSQSGSQRRQLRRAIELGEVDLVVGTHALVKSGVAFPRLGLVVVDEQHKFGVLQRAQLRSAGLDPHYLVMTATPIPRTIAMAIFGDLDDSILCEGPQGRQKVHTYWAAPQQRERWWKFFQKRLGEGRQGYVIAPRIDARAEPRVASAEQSFSELSQGPLAGFRVGLVHGRLSAGDKQAALEKFRSGVTRVLVATSVVEVGIDVSNATIMTIEDGQQFGLAQLHQLRGRVRRGNYPGYVCVFADPRTDEARERLEAFVHTSDGFQLAEVDYRLRGPGELFGTRQHGVVPLRIADLMRDSDVLQEARTAAQTLVAGDPQLLDKGYERLRQMVFHRYGEVFELGDVG